MLLLGVLQAQAAGAVAAGSFDLLETQVLASSAASVTFSSLSTYAADYQHLQIRLVARTNRSLADDILNVQFNTITSGYFWHQLSGDGSSVTSGAQTSQSSMRLGRTTDSGSAANAFGATVIDILDPFETTKNTTFRSLSGITSASFVTMFSGSVANTAAVSEIKLESGTGFSLVTGSRFSLYGIRGL